jgi:hypothetical protein
VHSAIYSPSAAGSAQVYDRTDERRRLAVATSPLAVIVGIAASSAVLVAVAIVDTVPDLMAKPST